ncbi:hypothetical protein SDC9_186001 [bioreactor metagenome]|uniref:Uncharacterized protein n=1 Tax=bioreactor metagenome TaxID=1076179 RepID=A0A645HHN6_9ZZZZ|nr:hypothetical protein [Victivallaceae bacterium]
MAKVFTEKFESGTMALSIVLSENEAKRMIKYLEMLIARDSGLDRFHVISNHQIHSLQLLEDIIFEVSEEECPDYVV